MNQLIEFCSRCVLQVTFFAGMGAIFYLVLRNKNPLRALLPVRCLAVIAILPLLFFIPRPQWEGIEDDLAMFFSASNDFADESTLDPERAEETKPLLAAASVPLVVADLLETEGDSETQGEFSQSSLALLAESNPATESVSEEFDYEFWKRGFLIVAALIGLLTLLRLVIAGRELVVRLRNSRQIEDVAVLAKLTALQSQFGVLRQVALRESSHDDVPATVGWRKPVILLPRLWHAWSAEQLQAVLAHELAHIRNHDFATWIAVQVPLLLHSYHPLVHWLARRVRWEQELLADRHAVEILGDRAGYLAALAELALGKTGHSGHSVRFSLAPNSSMLLGRLKMLRQSSAQSTSDQSNRPTSRLLPVLLLTLLVLVGFAITGLFSTPTPIYAEELASEKSADASITVADSVPPASNTALPASELSVVAELHSEKHLPQENGNETVTISALVEVLPLGPTEEKRNQNDWEAELQSHLAQMRSPHMMKSALAQQKVAKLALVTRQPNPLAWLQSNLFVSVKHKSRMLQIQFLNCPKEDAEQGVQLVTAFIQGFITETRGEKIHQGEIVHIQLFQIHKELTEDLRKEIENYETLSEVLGGKESPQSALQIQLLTSRLNRIDANIERLEEEQLLHIIILESVETATDTQMAKDKFFSVRLKQLAKRREELMQELEARNTTPASTLAMLESKIEQLLEIRSELAHRLRTMKINQQLGSASMRIIQSPVAY